MKFLNWTLFRLFVLINIYGTLTDNIAGTFRIVFKSVRNCDIEKKGTNEIEFVKPLLYSAGKGDTHFKSNVTIKTSVDKDVQVVIELSLWGNGGWKPNFFHFEAEDACKVYTEFFPDITAMLFQQAGVEDCPIPPGLYSFDFPLNNLKASNLLPSFPFGRYLFELSTNRGETRIGCFIGDVEVIPRKRRG